MSRSMNDSPSAETAVSRSLLRELVELRQIRTEKESLQQANIHYMTLVSHLELTISELKVQMQAKDSEVAKWKQRTKKIAKRLEKSSEESSSPRGDRSKEDLANRILLLEEENAQLKSYAALSNEMERLRLQLEQSNKLQTMYRDKYQETKVKLVTLATEQSEDSDSSPDPAEHRETVRALRKTEGSVGSLSPVGALFTPQVAAKHPASRLRRLSPASGADLIPNSCTPISCKTSTNSQKSSPMASFTAKLPGKTSAMLGFKVNNVRKLRRSHEVKSQGLSVYIPSFTRSKKGEKAAPRPGDTEKRQLDTVKDESEFAEGKELD